MRCLRLLPLLFTIANAAKIGIFTAAFSNSQIVFNIRIAESLAKAGHDVVLIRPEFNNRSTAIKSKNPMIREIHAKAAPVEVFDAFTDITHREVYNGLGFMEYLEFSNAYKELMNTACEAMLENDDFLDQIRAENIELAFHHHIDFCQHGIAHHLGIHKWVSMMPGPPHALIQRDIGAPYFNSYMPNMLQNNSMPMSFFDRLKTVAGAYAFLFFGGPKFENPQTEILRKKFGASMPHISELRKTAQLHFVNADPFLEYQFPTIQKLQYIGGIGTKDPSPLKEPFLSFVNKSKKLVVVSFGSVVQTEDMPESWRNAILALFRMNPEISFVWKFDEDIEVPENVLRTKWLPQNDLLALEKTIGFITHGGYNSLGEAVQSGTPCVFVPLFADQFRNSMLAQYRGIGLQLPKSELTADSLNSKLNSILNDTKYISAAKHHQTLAKGRLNSPEDVLNYWTNLILTTDLDISLPELSFVELYNIDVYAIFAVGALVVMSLLAFILRLLWGLYYWSCCEMAYKEKVKLQ